MTRVHALDASGISLHLPRNHQPQTTQRAQRKFGRSAFPARKMGSRARAEAAPRPGCRQVRGWMVPPRCSPGKRAAIQCCVTTRRALPLQTRHPESFPAWRHLQGGRQRAKPAAVAELICGSAWAWKNQTASSDAGRENVTLLKECVIGEHSDQSVTRAGISMV